MLLIIHEEGKLLCLRFGHEVCCPDAYGSDVFVPQVSLLEKSEACRCDLARRLCSNRQLALRLHAGEVICSDPNLDAPGGEPVKAKPVSDVLGEFEHDLIYFLFIFQVGCAGDSVTDRFDRAHEVLMHDPRLIRSRGISPERQTVHTEPGPQKLRRRFRDLPDRMDPVFCELCLRRRSDVDHVGSREGPYLFPIILPGKLCRGIRLL